MKFLINKAYRIRDRVDKDKVLGVKKLITFKEIIKKYPFGFNPSGYL